MEEILEGILLYFILLVVIFLLYYIFAVMNKKRLKKFKNNTYVKYLEGVYKLDLEKISAKDLAITIAMINSFIATTIFIILLIDNMILMFVIGFVLLLGFQLLGYHIAGKIFQKRFGRDKKCINSKK